MKILLLGNGFDLEHKLPTTYRDFLDFCKSVIAIYTSADCENAKYQYRLKLDSLNIESNIKDSLFHIFEERKCMTSSSDKNTENSINVTTSNYLINELYTHLKDNTWIKYFFQCSSYIGENWIDFESEISKVIQALDAERLQMECGDSVGNVEKNHGKIVSDIWKASNKRQFLDTLDLIDDFSVFLDHELGRLTRALEIYIAYFVQNIEVLRKSIDIERLEPDHVLSFNYSNTYERVYGKGKQICYNYIHGKARIANTLESCNLVLGIDEYLSDDRKNVSLEFLSFKKYYQRIYKSTDNEYLYWVDKIKDEYNEYMRQIKIAYEKDNQDTSSQSVPWLFNHSLNVSHIKCPQHTLYIFGHSLDITDKDVLKLLICNDNVQTKIYYYRKSEYDKTTLAKLIKNLIKIIGQDELIRRTRGANKTIQFVPQTVN